MAAAGAPGPASMKDYADFIVVALDGSEYWKWDEVALDDFDGILDTIDTALAAGDPEALSAAFHALVRLGTGRRILAQPTDNRDGEHDPATAHYPRERVDVIVDRLCSLGVASEPDGDGMATHVAEESA